MCTWWDFVVSTDFENQERSFLGSLWVLLYLYLAKMIEHSNSGTMIILNKWLAGHFYLFSQLSRYFRLALPYRLILIKMIALPSFSFLCTLTQKLSVVTNIRFYIIKLTESSTMSTKIIIIISEGWWPTYNLNRICGYSYEQSSM